MISVFGNTLNTLNDNPRCRHLLSQVFTTDLVLCPTLLSLLLDVYKPCFDAQSIMTLYAPVAFLCRLMPCPAFGWI